MSTTTSTSGTSPSVRIRQNIRTLTGVNDDLFWYARAVEELKTRALDRPTSWWYQAAVHGIPANPAVRAQLGLQVAPVPSAANVKTFWDQCQHQSWYFLPWHRGYLAAFEEIIAATVVQLGGPDGWALPYWNYTDTNDPNARFLPQPFLNQTDPSGGSNPLWVDGRILTAAGQVELNLSTVSLDALTDSIYEGSLSAGTPGFGGIATGFHHGGRLNGGLEATPHNLVHVDVGGWMGNVDAAAADPIFWLHHANVDRLWEVWVNRPGNAGNPTKANWLTGITFNVHGSNNRVISFAPGDMIDTTKVLHGYVYDDISDPLAGVTGPMVVAVSPAPAQGQAVMVAASRPRIPVTLGDDNVVRVTFDAPAHQAALAAATAAARLPQAFLHVENMTGAGTSGSYEVYVKPPGDTRVPILAGAISTFGVAQASQPDSHGGGSGITTVLNITKVVQQLHRERDWNGQDLDVAIRPTRSAELAHSHPDTRLNIGRLSIYYA